MTPDTHLFLCYITDILDILILIGNVFVLSSSIKLYTEVLKIHVLGEKLDRQKH